MSLLPITVPPKRLAQSISSSAVTFKLNNIKGWDNVNLAAGNFGTEAYAVFMNSTRTQIEVMKFDPTTIASASITILARGLEYNGGDIQVPANKYAWPSNDTTVQLGTDAPQLFRDFLSATNTATITAKHTYTELPESAVVPVDPNDLTNKAYVDDKASSATSVLVTQNGHAFVVGDVIRLSGINTYAKAQANNATNAEVAGIVNEVIDANNFSYATEGVITVGVPVAVANSVMFLSPTTAGLLTSTEPTTIGHVSVPLGVIIQSGTTMLFHKYRGAQLNTIAGNPIASETVAGIVEEATQAQATAGTDVGETGARLFVPPSKILAMLPAAVIDRTMNLMETVDTTTTPLSIEVTNSAIALGVAKTATGSSFRNRYIGMATAAQNLTVAVPANVFGAGSASATQSVTVPAGTNLMMVVFGTAGDNGGGATAPSGYTWNGIPLTVISTSYGNGTQRGGVYVLPLGSPVSPVTADLIRTGGVGINGVFNDVVIYNNCKQVTTIGNSISQQQATTFSSSYESWQVSARHIVWAGGRISAGTVNASGSSVIYTDAFRQVGHLQADGNGNAWFGCAGAGTSSFLSIGIELLNIPQSLNVRFSGIVTGFTGLVPGSRYYISATPGVISTSVSGTSIGLAISATELLLS